MTDEQALKVLVDTGAMGAGSKLWAPAAATVRMTFTLS